MARSPSPTRLLGRFLGKSWWWLKRGYFLKPGLYVWAFGRNRRILWVPAHPPTYYVCRLLGHRIIDDARPGLSVPTAVPGVFSTGGPLAAGWSCIRCGNWWRASVFRRKGQRRIEMVPADQRASA